jgi:hypoxanthine phosphoribosyltransferase
MEIKRESIKVLYDRPTIQNRIAEMGRELSEIFAPLTDTLYMVCVLKGSTHFFSELLLNISLDVHYMFIQVASYSGSSSTGRIVVKSWIEESVQGQHVIVVEDILDTGKTLKYILNYLSKYNPKSLEVATLVNKASKDHTGVTPKYVGFEAPDYFLLGYGLDYNQKFRNLPFIGYIPTDEEQ